MSPISELVVSKQALGRQASGLDVTESLQTEFVTQLGIHCTSEEITALEALSPLSITLQAVRKARRFKEKASLKGNVPRRETIMGVYLDTVAWELHISQKKGKFKQYIADPKRVAKMNSNGLHKSEPAKSVPKIVAVPKDHTDEDALLVRQDFQNIVTNDVWTLTEAEAKQFLCNNTPEKLRATFKEVAEWVKSQAEEPSQESIIDQLNWLSASLRPTNWVLKSRAVDDHEVDESER